MSEDVATCKSFIFWLRFGFRRSLYEQLFLANAPLIAFVQKLGLKGDTDVARLMRVFHDVDTRGTHSLDMETFFGYFDIELTEYNKRAFRLLAFGEQKIRRRRSSSVELNFDQFFVSMYNYGTLIHEALVRFAFDVMASGKDWCNKQDVLSLVSLIHSDASRVKETAATLMDIMDPHNRDKISYHTFRSEEKRLGSMLFPAYKLQKTLRTKVLGTRYWRKATKKRRKARLLGADLCREYTKIQDNHRQKLRAEAVCEIEDAAKLHEKNGSDVPEAVHAKAEAADGDESDHLDNDMQAETPQLMVGSEEDAEHRMESSTGGASSPTSSSFSSVGSGGDGEEHKGHDRRVSWAEAGGSYRRPSHPHGTRQPFTKAGPTAAKEDSPEDRQKSISHKRESARQRMPSASMGNEGSRGHTQKRLVRMAEDQRFEGERRRSSAKTLPQGVPGRRGSMFEDMQVFDSSIQKTILHGRPSLGAISGTSPADAITRRRSSANKLSRVAAGTASGNEDQAE